MLYRYRSLIKWMIAFSALMLALGVAALVALHWYVSTESFKQKVTGALKSYTGYDLVVEGGMGVTLYPWIGFAAGPVQVRKPGLDDPILSAQRVSAGVRLLPLLSGDIDLDTVAFEDVLVEVVRSEDGSTPWDDLIATLTPEQGESSGAGQVRGITLRGVQVDNGSLVYRDLESGRSWEAHGFNLRTGVLEKDRAIALSVETRIVSLEHGLAGQITVTGSLGVDFKTGHLTLADGRMDAEFAYDRFKGADEPVQLTSAVSLDTAREELVFDNLYAKAAGVDLTGRVAISGLLSGLRAMGEVETRSFSPRELFNTISPGFIPDDDQGIFRKGSISSGLIFDGQSLVLDQLDVRMDDSHVTGHLDLPLKEDGILGFQLVLDSLDFDRYYRLFITPEDFVLDDFFPEFIRTWRASGSLTADSVIIAGEETGELALALNCADGLLDVRADRALAMGGEAEGAFLVRVAAEGADYRVAITSTVELKGARAESLPLGASEDHVLEGAGDLSVAWEVPAKIMAPDQIIDDLLRDTRLNIDWSLRSGGLVLLDGLGEPEEPRALDWDQARISLALAGNGRGGGHDDFRFQAGGALKLLGPAGGWDVNAKLSGGLDLDFTLENLSLENAELGLQYRGEPLPPGDPLAVLTAVVSLDTAADTATLTDLHLDAAGLVFGGGVTGRAVLSKGYAYNGELSLDSTDPRKAWALLKGVEGVKTSDPEALKTLKGRADLLVSGGDVNLTNVSLSLDQTTFTGRAFVTDLGAGRVSFRLAGDGFDMDRYRAPRPERPELPEEDRPDCTDLDHGPSTPLPLETLRALDLDGSVTLDAFKVYGFRFTNLNFGVEAGNGTLSVPVMTADFYQGKVKASLDLFVRNENLDAMIDFDAMGFMAKEFLGDQFERDYVHGQSDLNLHFRTSGATDDDLIERLGGSAGFTIRDGSYKFMGAPKVGEPEPPAPAPQDNAMGQTSAPKDSRTSFSLARAVFAVNNGRFDLTDFQVKSLALSATGEGFFDVAKNSINLAFNADFVAAPDVPIYIDGCLFDPDVAVPGDEILQNAVEDIITIPLRPLQFLRDTLF